MLKRVYCVRYMYLYTTLLKRKWKYYILAYARRKKTSSTKVYVVSIPLLEFIINLSFKLLGLDPHAVNLCKPQRRKVYMVLAALRESAEENKQQAKK